MGFLDNYGTGAQSFVDNYLKVSQFDQQKQLEQQRLMQQKAYQDAILAMQQQGAQREQEEYTRSNANRQGMMGAINSSVTPGGEYMAQGEDPTTGEMQSQGIPYDPKMDYGKALIGATPYLDKNTKPQFDALMEIRNLPVKDRKAALDELVAMSNIDKNTARAAKDRREPPVTPEKTPSIPLYVEQSIGNGMEQKFLWNPETKAHDKPFGEPYPMNAKSPRVNVETKVGTDSMSELGKEMSKALVAKRTDAEGAAKSLVNMQEATDLLDSGMITGTGAEYLVGMGNLLSSRLGYKKATDPVANSQAFAATMGNQVGQIIKQFGSGTGLSDADREYAEKIVGGKITLNEQSIRKLMSINKKALENVVNNYNKDAGKAMTKPGSDQLPYDLRVEMPQAATRKTVKRTGTDTATGKKVTEWSDGSVTRSRR